MPIIAFYVAYYFNMNKTSCFTVLLRYKNTINRILNIIILAARIFLKISPAEMNVPDNCLMKLPEMIAINSVKFVKS